MVPGDRRRVLRRAEHADAATGRPGPFALSDPVRTRAILGQAGFDDIEISPLSEPMWFGRDANDAVTFIPGTAGWMLDGLDEGARDRALSDLRDSAEAHVVDDGVAFGSATWLVTARRRG